MASIYTINNSIIFSIILAYKNTDDNTQYSDWGQKHTVAWQECKTKGPTSSCQKPWENIPEIQPRRQSWVCGVSFIRRALCWEQRREESVALSPKPTVRHLAWEWMNDCWDWKWTESQRRIQAVLVHRQIGFENKYLTKKKESWFSQWMASLGSKIGFSL